MTTYLGRGGAIPIVVGMLDNSDRVARGPAVELLAEVRAVEAVVPLGKRLAPAVEKDDTVREGVVRALRTLGDARAVHPLVDAATRDPEPDISVAMAVAAFELAGAGQDDDLRRAGDILAKVMVDDAAPRAARRDASDALRAHVSLGPACHDDPTAATWWKDHRNAVAWRAADHRLVLLQPAADP